MANTTATTVIFQNQLILISLILPVFIFLFFGFFAFILYKTRYDCLPIHVCWAFFFVAEAFLILSYEVSVLIQLLGITQTCWNNTLMLFGYILFCFAVIVWQVDGFAALYYNSKYSMKMTKFKVYTAIFSALVISLAISVLTPAMDARYMQCLYPLAIRFTKPVNVLVEGTTSLLTIMVIVIVSIYAAAISLKPAPNAIHTTNTLDIAQSKMRMEIEENKDKVTRAEGLTDVFYRQSGSGASTSVETTENIAEANVNQSNSTREYVMMARRILSMNKISIILIIGMSAPSILGLWFTNCETYGSCEDFIDKHNKLKGITFILLVLQIYHIFQNIGQIVMKPNDQQS